jgi:hypothetical protein
MDKKTILLASLTGVLFVTTVMFGLLYFFNNDSDSDNPSQEIASYYESDLETVDKHDHLLVDEYFESLPEEDLSQEEIDGLLLMREEEKLAHDIYTKLYEKWGQKIFNNISESEQTHTDMVAELLIKYDIEDPVKSNEVGVFENQDLAYLYNDLVDQGENSFIDALTVGATVEDLDISDLQVLMEQADNEDILTVYQNLTKGSRNHIRAFTRQLNRNGESYKAQYITEEEYDEIVGSPSENGVFYDSKGRGRNMN